MAESRNITTKLTIQNLAASLKEKFAAIKTDLDNSLKSAKIDGSKIKLFTTTATTGAAAFTLDLPEEMFLDQTKTKFIQAFEFDEDVYTGATDPDLDDKPVMVLAVKTVDAEGTETIAYSFLDMSKLVDTYSAKAGDGTATVTVDGYEISVDVNVSAEAGNLLVKKNDGLYVKDTTVSGATKDNIAGFGDDGVFVDTGIAKANLVLATDISDYTKAEIDALLAETSANPGE